MEVLVFGGTVEGRLLVEWLDGRRSCRVVVSTATEYGASLLEGMEHVTVIHGQLSDEEKRQLVEEHDFCCVVDATHPYAQHISQSVRRLADDCGKDLVCIVREEGQDGSGAIVEDAEAAARLLVSVEGNILLTTGSKDLPIYAEQLSGHLDRLFVRVLPTVSAISRAEGLGITASHLIAMQGPFSQEMNEAMIRQLDIRWLVTKESGSSGGFDEKVGAARATGAELIVIKRPQEQEGVTLSEAKALLEERYGL